MASVIGILILFFASVNLPFSQRFVTKKINQVFSHAGLPIHVMEINTILPSRIHIQGAGIIGPEGDTLIYAGDLRAGYGLTGFLRRKVILKKVNISDVRVRLSRDQGSPDYDIAELFSGGETAGSGETGNSGKFWEISVEKAALFRVGFDMNDARLGTRLMQEIEALSMEGFSLSLSDQAIFFQAADIREATGGYSLVAHEPVMEADTVATPWNFGFGELSLQGFRFSFDNSVDSLGVEVKIGAGSIHASRLDLAENDIDMDGLFLSRASARISTGNATPNSSGKYAGEFTGSGKAPPEPFPWNITSGSIDLEKAMVFLGSYPGADSATPEFTVTELDMNLTELRLSNDAAGVRIGSLGFDLGNGFSLASMKGTLDSDGDSLRMELALETGHSILNLEGATGMGIFQLINDPAAIGEAQFAIGQSSVSLRDLLYFKRELNENEAIMILAREPVRVAGGFILRDARMTVPGITFTQGRNFSISVWGTVDHPFPFRQSEMELQAAIPEIGKAWLDAMLAGLGIENQVPSYNSLALEGTLSQLPDSTEFSLKINSDMGTIDLSGSLDLDDESYSLNSSFDRVRIGEILSNEDLGTLNGSGEITGSGFRLETLTARVRLEVDSLGYRGHEYIRTSMEGILSPEVYELHILSDDPSLRWDLNAMVYPFDSVFAVAATTNLFARLHDLHLYNDTLSLEGNITANFKKGMHAIESELTLSDLKLTTPGNEAEVKYLNALFKTDSLETSFAGTSDFFQAEAMINRPTGELGTLMENYRNYGLSIVDPLHEDAANRVAYLSDMIVTSNIDYHDVFKIFIPDTSLRFTNLDFSLLHKASDNRVQYLLKGTGLEYKTLKSGNLTAYVMDSAGILNLQLEATDNFINTTPANKFLVTSSFSEWNSLTDLTLLNRNNEVLYGLEISSGVDLDSNLIVLKVPSKQLILNRQQWLMETPDLATVDLAGKKLLPELRMRTDSSQLHLYTRAEDEMRLISCELTDVALASILVDNVLPGNPQGTISGTVNYQVNEGPGKYFNTGFRINHASWSGIAFNQIDVEGKLSSGRPGSYAMDFSARLDSSRIVLEGELKDSLTRNIRTEFSAIPLQTFQPFVREYLSELKGGLSGNFNISSVGQREAFGGGIHFNDARLRVNALNSKFKVPQDSLIFKDKRLLFNRFRILDSLNNELQVDGYVDFSDRRSITTDLGISSSRLQVMNTGEEANASFYGNAIVDSRLSFRGPIESPVIKGNIQLSGGSDLYYRHMEDLSLSESEKIVRFVDFSNKEAPSLDGSDERPRSIGESSIETLVKIDPSTRIHFNLSKRIYNIDLMIRGGASLNYQMLKNNQVSLAGRYEISEGTADLKMVGWPSKSFRIAEGGYIRWDGMLEDPELKFEASNRVRSSYTNPVDGKQRDVDFNVLLQLSNRLSELDVLFTINTSDQYLMSIINTLSPEEKMKQAITILLFENIDLPGISTTTSYMTEQVNQLVASQLNQLTKTTIKGIDISFGLDSYVQATQSGGEQTKTSLSYEVRKGLLNERAQIELSGRLNDLTNQPGASDLSINNISFEYRLDSAATTFLKVYNEHAYEDVFEGEVISTGVGITYRKRYRIFREIWKRDPADKKTRKQSR